MTHAIRIHKTGGPEVLSWEEVQLGKPGPGEACIRHTAVGLNFIDMYHRSGLYPLPLPSGLGSEAAGIVEAIGPGVSEVKPGDRVAYAGGPLGAYSEARLMPPDRLVRLPEGISDRGRAMMLKGMTVEYLVRRTFRVDPATLCCATLRPAASASSPANGPISAPRLSARSDRTRRRARQVTWLRALDRLHARGFRGRVARSPTATRCRWSTTRSAATRSQALDCLAPLGLLASSGSPRARSSPSISALWRRRDHSSSHGRRSDLWCQREAMAAMAKELFDVVQSGAVKIDINQTYPLKDVFKAHRDLEARKTTGSTVLTIQGIADMGRHLDEGPRGSGVQPETAKDDQVNTVRVPIPFRKHGG